MKKELTYLIFFLLPALYSCLDTPYMTDGIVNMREEPTVTTKADTVFSNENFTLILKGEVLTYGKNSRFFDQGFYWGTDSTNLDHSIFFPKNSNVETDTFSYNLQNLDGNLTYFWRAAAKNQYGTALGEIRMYKTPSEEPSVESGKETPVPADGSLLFTGKVLAYGKINSIFVRGFRWGTEAGKFTDSVSLENNSFESDAFSYILPNVRGNTVYYWQAFAKNDYGTSYGTVNTHETPDIFTPSGPFTLLFRINFTVFTLKNMLFLTCGQGRNNYPLSETYRYNDNGYWWRNDDFPGLARRYAAAFTIGDSLAYVGTGQSSERAPLRDFYVFNGNNGLWSETPVEMPSGMERYEAVAFSLNGKGYIAGGHAENTVFNDVWEFSINGSWKKMNNFPKEFYGGLCFYNNQRVFVGFGAENSLWEYDSVNDKWNEFAQAPIQPLEGVVKFSSGILAGDKIYLLDKNNTIWELDLTTKQYKQKSKLPGDFPDTQQYMFRVGDIIYIIYIGVGTDIYKYYPLWDN